MLLVVVAVFLALFGAANLTPATIGVGVICLACFVGILARIVQASAHQQVPQGIVAPDTHRDAAGQSPLEKSL